MITRARHTLLFSTPWHPLLSFLKKRTRWTWSTWPFINSRAQLSAMLSSDRRGFNQPKARFNYKQKMIVTHLSESRVSRWHFIIQTCQKSLHQILVWDLTWNPPWLIPQPPFSIHTSDSFHFSPKRKNVVIPKVTVTFIPCFLPEPPSYTGWLCSSGSASLCLPLKYWSTWFFVSLQKMGRFLPIW